MKTTELITLENVAFRAVSANYVMGLAQKLSKNSLPDLKAALEEIVEVISERLGNNLAEGEVVIYYPSTSKDPYVFGIPVNPRGAKTKGSKEPPKEPTTFFNTTTDLQADFESIMLENDSCIKKHANGKYLNPIVNAKWEGFRLYHTKLGSGLKRQQGKLLGRYVVSRVTPQGAAIFHEIPFRHATRELATVEANRLASTYGSGFGIFRCIEIVNEEIDNASN